MRLFVLCTLHEVVSYLPQGCVPENYAILWFAYLLPLRYLVALHSALSLNSGIVTLIAIIFIPHSFRVILMIQSTKGLFLELYKISSITSTIWMKIWSFTLRLVLFKLNTVVIAQFEYLGTLIHKCINDIVSLMYTFKTSEAFEPTGS